MRLKEVPEPPAAFKASVAALEAVETLGVPVSDTETNLFDETLFTWMVEHDLKEHPHFSELVELVRAHWAYVGSMARAVALTVALPDARQRSERYADLRRQIPKPPANRLRISTTGDTMYSFNVLYRALRKAGQFKATTEPPELLERLQRHFPFLGRAISESPHRVVILDLLANPGSQDNLDKKLGRLQWAAALLACGTGIAPTTLIAKLQSRHPTRRRRRRRSTLTQE